MNTANLKEYAELKIQEKAIVARIKELSPVIKQEMLDEGKDKQPTSVGNFLIVRKKKWTFSPNIASIETALEEAMEKEKADGTATFEEVAQLEFRQEKNNE